MIYKAKPNHTRALKTNGHDGFVYGNVDKVMGHDNTGDSYVENSKTQVSIWDFLSCSEPQVSKALVQRSMYYEMPKH